jgi:hypothetical protein
MGRWAQRRRCGTATSGDPPRVVTVTRIDANHADWLFDQPVTVSGTCLQCKISGSSPGASAQQTASTMRGTYSLVNSSAPWTLTGTETNLTPRPATGQSGTSI